MNIMDYSLLLGIHYVNKGNEKTVERRKSLMSLPRMKSSSPLNEEEQRKQEEKEIDEVLLPSPEMKTIKSIFTSDQGGYQATDDRGTPMGEIYYMGIIDILQKYSLKKKLEHSFKSITQDSEGLSAVGAGHYARRFYQFIAERTGSGPLVDLRNRLTLKKKKREERKKVEDSRDSSLDRSYEDRWSKEDKSKN